MKYLLFIIIIVFSMQCFAQDPQLFENDWYLQKVVIDGQDFYPPNVATEQIIGTIHFFESIDILSINYCDFTDATIEFDLILDIFNLQDYPSILIGDCLNPENISFGMKYFSVFYNQQHIAKNPFFYSFTTENEILTLTIVNSDGDKAIYGNELLSTHDFFTNLFSLYPNPVQDILNIENYSNYTIESVQIYDVLGRLVLNINNGLNQLDLSNLDSGILFVKIETDDGVLVKKIVKN